MGPCLVFGMQWACKDSRLGALVVHISFYDSGAKRLLVAAWANKALLAGPGYLYLAAQLYSCNPSIRPRSKSVRVLLRV